MRSPRGRRRARPIIVPRTRWAFGDKRLNVMGGGDRHAAALCIEILRLVGAITCCSIPGRRACWRSSSPTISARSAPARRAAVATEKMTRAGAGKVALIGTGRQARTQALALKAVGRLNALAVVGPRSRPAGNLLRQAQGELGVPVRAAASGEDAVAGADIVVAATNSAEPVVMNAWLEARYACRGHGRQCGQSPRDRCGDRAAGLAPGHRRCRAGQDGSRRIHRPHQSRQARLEQGEAAA